MFHSRGLMTFGSSMSSPAMDASSIRLDRVDWAWASTSYASLVPMQYRALPARKTRLALSRDSTSGLVGLITLASAGTAPLSFAPSRSHSWYALWRTA